MSTQCHACPAMTASNVRPAASHSSNFATSTSSPLRRAQVGHPRVGVDAEHPAAGRLEQPGRQAGAAAGVDDGAAGAPGLPVTIRSTIASG